MTKSAFPRLLVTVTSGQRWFKVFHYFKIVFRKFADDFLAATRLNKDGDVIFSTSTVELGSSVKDACEAILSDTKK